MIFTAVNGWGQELEVGSLTVAASPLHVQAAMGRLHLTFFVPHECLDVRRRCAWFFWMSQGGKEKFWWRVL